MRRFAFLIFFAFLLISGCNKALTGKAVSEQYPYEDIKIQAYFCPREDCGKIINDAVDNAKNSVHCAFFDLNLKDLISTLAEKSHAADVKVVIDYGNYEGQIKGEGVRTVKSKQYMHNKFCIIDGYVTLTGSTNPTDNDAERNNNNLAIIKSGYIAKNYEDEFDELWNGVYASGNNVKYNKISTNFGQIENYFCPEDCTSRDWGINKIISLVKGANKSVKMAIFSFTHEELGDELVKADIKGINVSVLIESKQRNVQNSQYSRLRDFGLNIRVDGNKYNMHHKFIVIDNKLVITGSPNFSWSGFNRNDENMLVIYDEGLAQKYIREFNILFDDGEVI